MRRAGWVRAFTSTTLESSFDELGEGAGAVADPVLPAGFDLAEGQHVAVGNEDRVVAETAVAARWPDEPALDLAAEEFGVSVGPGESEHCDKRGAAIPVAELAVNSLHRNPKILVLAGPAGGIDPRLPAERGDDETGIISERRQSARLYRGPGLQLGIRFEAVAGFLGLLDAESADGDGGGAKRRQQRRYLRAF